MDLIQEAKELGFTKAVNAAEEKLTMIRKLHLAYQHYEFITEEKIEAFKEKLKAKTLDVENPGTMSVYHNYDTLLLQSPETYKAIPPAEVLAKFKEAKARGVFDTYEVASIESVREYKDPILFGLVSGCTDRFFICEWGDDVSFAELRKGEPKA